MYRYVTIVTVICITTGEAEDKWSRMPRLGPNPMPVTRGHDEHLF